LRRAPQTAVSQTASDRVGINQQTFRLYLI
jgi:hypothetical protein